MRRILLLTAALAVLLGLGGAGRAEACGAWIGPGVAWAYPPCVPAYPPPPVYPGYAYGYPPVYGYAPWPPPPVLHQPFYRGPAYWYYRSLRRDDWYDRPRIQGYTLR